MKKTLQFLAFAALVCVPWVTRVQAQSIGNDPLASTPYVTGVDVRDSCDKCTWIDGRIYTMSTADMEVVPTYTYHLSGYDSIVTLQLTIRNSSVRDTNAVEYSPYTWYEYTGMNRTQTVQHVFAGANAVGCDSIVRLHLSYPLYYATWTGTMICDYNGQPQNGITASYTDDNSQTHDLNLTFYKGNSVIIPPAAPVNAGTYTIVARTTQPLDSIINDTMYLTIRPAKLFVTGAAAKTAKLYDGNSMAEVTAEGTLNGVQNNDPITHVTTASFNDAAIGENKTVTITYSLAVESSKGVLDNYDLDPISTVYSLSGAILAPMTPDDDYPTGDDTEMQNGIEVYAYGYCTGSSYSIRYHLTTGNPDQYMIDFTDSRFTDVPWTNLTSAGPNGTIDIDVPVDLPTGDYSMTVTFRDSRYTWVVSAPLTVTFHVNLPQTYTMPLFDNVIALVDTCHCFTEIQWYHRANATDTWQPIAGANGYYYREANGLTGEYFVKAKMNGTETYTCPQTDVNTLINDGEQGVKVNIWPNPTTKNVSVTVSGSNEITHTLRVINTMGIEMESRTFDGIITTIDMSGYQRGNYIVSVDGVVVRVVRN